MKHVHRKDSNMRKDHVRGRIRKALTKGMSVILVLSSSFGTGAFAAPGTITEPEEAEIVSEGDAADTAETVGYAQEGIITEFKPLEKDTMFCGFHHRQNSKQKWCRPHALFAAGRHPVIV